MKNKYYILHLPTGIAVHIDKSIAKLNPKSEIAGAYLGEHNAVNMPICNLCVAFFDSKKSCTSFLRHEDTLQALYEDVYSNTDLNIYKLSCSERSNFISEFEIMHNKHKQ